jgi:hypothetical protein
MVSERLIKLYYEKLKKPTIIYGLVLHPFMVGYQIKWEVENPNDVSFASTVVEGHLEEMLHDFLTLAGITNAHYPSSGLDWSQLSIDYCKLTKSDVYINKEIRNKINRSFNNLKEITLNDSGSILIAKCFIKDWSIEYIDTEALGFHLDLELFNPNIDGENVDDDTLQDYIQSFIYDETSHDQEAEIIWEAASIVQNEKNLFDNDYMYTQAIIGYYDSFGNGLT